MTLLAFLLGSIGIGLCGFLLGYWRGGRAATIDMTDFFLKYHPTAAIRMIEAYYAEGERVGPLKKEVA